MNGRTLVVALYFLATGAVGTLAILGRLPLWVGLIMVTVPLWIGMLAAGFSLLYFASRRRREARDEDGAWRRGYREGRRDAKTVENEFGTGELKRAARGY